MGTLGTMLVVAGLGLAVLVAMKIASDAARQDERNRIAAYFKSRLHLREKIRPSDKGDTWAPPADTEALEAFDWGVNVARNKAAEDIASGFCSQYSAEHYLALRRQNR